MYVRTQWKSGDTVTSEKLNNMENGISQANSGVPIHVMPLIVTATAFNVSVSIACTPGDLFDEDDNLIALPMITYKYNNSGTNITRFDMPVVTVEVHTADNPSDSYVEYKISFSYCDSIGVILTSRNRNAEFSGVDSSGSVTPY